MKETPMPAWVEDDLQGQRRQGLYRERRRLESGQGVEVRWRLRDFLNFSSNDYLAYAGDPRLARAAARAAYRFGCGAGASALVSGYLPPLRALERDLAAWQGREAALVFSSGFAGNLAVVSTLTGKQGVIFSDAHNHASLIDGCRLARASVHVYRHNDPDHLGELLRDHAATAKRRLIVSDSVFSMEGDRAPLSELFSLAEQHDALLIIDEAHATGVLGEAGRGLTETLPLEVAASERLVKLGTLSKALGAQGGFVCGSRQLIDYLINHARPYIFSTALAPPLAAAAARAVSLVGQEPQRRLYLLALAERLRRRLKEVGLDPGQSSSHIVPILVGDPRAAVALSRQLEKKRLLVPAIRPPSVPEGTSRLRIGLTAGHTDEDVTRLVEALRSA
jgi:8-amino-7-oxononanoate synthase